MGRTVTICLAMVLTLSACRQDVLVVGGVPAAPRALTVSYYGGSVTVSWELAPEWDGEAFRIYSRRVTDTDFFFIAEVTSCIGGFCTYEDLNVVQNQTYEYYVAAVGSGSETATTAVSVFVPTVTPPPVPDLPFVIALDNANYLTWGDASRVGAGDFSFYKVYLDDGGTTFLLGETDSEGFLDQRAGNGTTYSYFVTALDADGHESLGSASASGTPRPDYHGEWIYAWENVPALSGFFFQTDETTEAVVDGNGTGWDVRMESDGNQWWLQTGAGVAIHDNGGFVTTALKCGVGADFNCTDVSVAPTINYATGLFEMIPQTTYVIRVNDTDGVHYGAIRVEFVGFDQSDPIMIFDWAYQLQPGNLNLVSPAGN
ncbi:MAG: fibronectin type III domain-containing protein [Gemmatimonadota bacterium]|nr:fibronectin type III domain-containing protein [Gemmatimonadota bacterium]